MKSQLADFERIDQMLVDQQDPRRVALQKMLGVRHNWTFSRDSRGVVRPVRGAPLQATMPTFESLQEAYTSFTGKVGPIDLARTAAEMNTFTFVSAFADALQRRFIQDYRVSYRVEDISQPNSAENFRALKRVRGKYVADLETVPQEWDFPEAVVQGDEEITYGGVITKGALLTITRTAWVNNDIGGIERAIEQLVRSAQRTLARRAWSKIIDNDLYSADGVALFHANHSNLGATALSIATLTAARLAVFAQTEPGSDEPLGLGSGSLLLVVPPDLEATARSINHQIPTDSNANPWYEAFGAANERIYTCPFFTDANDWALFDISGNVPILEITYLMGNSTPQIVLADNPAEGSSFYKDSLQYKIRHEYEVGILDYRGGYKAVVT